MSGFDRLPELRAEYVVGTRPVTIDGRRFNQGYLWSAAGGLVPLRRKFFLPDEPGGWEAHWFDRGDPDFPEFHAGALSFGLNICTELWALETYAAYAAAASRSSCRPARRRLRRRPSGCRRAWWRPCARVLSACRPTGWIRRARAVAWAGSSARMEGFWRRTTPDSPFATIDIDLAASAAAREGYPRYVFSGERSDLRRVISR